MNQRVVIISQKVSCKPYSADSTLYTIIFKGFFLVEQTIFRKKSSFYRILEEKYLNLFELNLFELGAE